MILRFALSVALAAASTAFARPPATAADVAAAERRFAAMAQAEGLGPAFAAWSAEDAVIFTPRPASAKAAYADPNNRPSGRLEWWPVYAGIARSGDLGFSTGPFEVEGGQAHGWYFTIWRREADGRWRWVLDHGTPTREAASYGSDAPLTSAPAGRASRRAAGSWDEVRAAEARLAAALAADARTALPAALWDDGRIMRPGPQPAVGRAAFAAAAAAGPARIEASRIGGGVSKAGDLAWTYGDAAWDSGGARLEGHYVRVWQRRPGGWKLLVDEMTPLPRRRATPAGG
jgi:ketosteroid isomerase-like protein